MAHAQQLPVKESADEIKRLLSGASAHLRPRLKMLQQLSRGVFSIDTLAAKVGASRNSIAAWKRLYKNNGVEALLADQRGGDHRSSIDAAGKQQLEAKLSDPNDAFTSFGQAQDWIKENLGVEMNYHAVNKYLKRNFGAKLKVGRKSHVKKDAEAVAFFKKPVGGAGTY